MARIKAKPINRIPITPVLRNGVRTTTPPAVSSTPGAAPQTAVYDPAQGAPQAAVFQRPAPNYVFPPGTTIPPYGGVHVFVSNYFKL